MQMHWLQADDDTTPDRFAGDTPVDSESSQRDTREDVFKREHDQLINSEAVQTEKASRENLRRFVESEVERIKPRQEQYEAQQAARAARRDEARQKSKDRAASARAASEDRRAQREEERKEREAKVTDFAEAKRKRALGQVSKQGGEEKSYTARAKAAFYIDKIKSLVNAKYQDQLSDVKEAERSIKGTEVRLRDIKREISSLRLQMSKIRGTYERELMRDDMRAKQHFEQAKKEQLHHEQELRYEESRQKRTQLQLKAQLQKDTYELKELKKLSDKVERARLNRTDPLGELQKLHTELSRYKINLPNLRLAA